MSQNTTSTDFPGTSSTGGGTTGTTGTTGQTGTTGSTNESFATGTTGTSGTGSATGTATALAQEYGSKITEAASQAKDYVTDKVSVVGDKLKDLQNADFSEMAENAKDYARNNPGQAILISAAAGLLVGLILRGRR
ncbi:MAG TPA: hypothetical protein VIW64_15625 [Pyrinomonadaceae bacterium]|jgi:ElaB/YqjD/DUF883 family membrane-anchored ribosome-binding protein